MKVFRRIGVSVLVVFLTIGFCYSVAWGVFDKARAVVHIVFMRIRNKSWSFFCNFRDSHLLLQSGLSEALGSFIYSEGVDSVKAGPVHRGQTRKRD